MPIRLAVLPQQQQHHIAEIGTSKVKHSSVEMVEITAGVKGMKMLLATHTQTYPPINIASLVNKWTCNNGCC
jgi:hypothetical protein